MITACLWIRVVLIYHIVYMNLFITCTLIRRLFLAQLPIYTINYLTFPALWIGTGKCVLIKSDKIVSK